jgi:hypothetical protein
MFGAARKAVKDEDSAQWADGIREVPAVVPAPTLTKDQAAIIGVYTGVTCGPFSDIQEYAERLLGRPVYTHEFASPAMQEKLAELARPDFLRLCRK